MINLINNAHSQNAPLATVFLDLSKAFDSINHEVLLRKLYKYGIRGTPHDFFTSYFHNRRQFTKVDNINSNISLVKRGVPQSSALGPLLFIIYLNDITNVNLYSRLIIYADDIVLVHTHSNKEHLKTEIEKDLNSVSSYFNSNDLTPNNSKTKKMFFTRSKNSSLNISFNNTLVEGVDEFRYLGLVIDKELKFKTHILKLSSKINSANYLISSIKFILPEIVLIKLYYSMVHSHLNNHILAWGGTNQISLQPLKVSVNNSIRLICQHPLDTTNKFGHHKILTIPEIYKLKCIEFLYKTINLNKPPLLDEILPSITFNHQHNTRNSRLRLPIIHTEFNRRFFLSNAVKFWNQLPEPIRNLDVTVHSFKYTIKKQFQFTC